MFIVHLAPGKDSDHPYGILPFKNIESLDGGYWKNYFFSFILNSFTASAQPSVESIELTKTILIADAHMHTYLRGGPSSSSILE